ncbi:MAG: universal stress protein [Proteobacteria bacterium]|nr:universal stress protein [Pseudomonadota bacterium]MBU4009581.1 universal stress protein [Pseudomonadota bacterium]MBU4037491.1 universal stress protein [Pseudomonadota bacterium]
MKNVIRVLIPVDGSKQSLTAVRYVGNILKPKNARVVLFYVDSELPESFWDLEKNPEFRSKLAPVKAWAAQRKQLVSDSMTKASKILINDGFPAEALSTKMQGRKIGIARDILQEANTGEYRAVVVGRTGISNAKGIVLGSVANKLIGNLVEMPLIIIGGKPNTNKFLIAFDGSKGSMKCVTTAGAMLNNTDSEIMICHVIRSLGIEQQSLSDIPISELEKDWTEANIKKIKPAMEEAKKKLIAAGINPSKISEKILTDKASRAGSIIAEAREGGYGTIILGRRGLSATQEYFIGRVSRKILHMAKKFAVWVVN